ncbi:MAG: universal stress protein [Croceimicrobium sp.]
MKNRQILFPTDFSESSLNCLNAVLPFIIEGDNKLTIVHGAQRERKSLAADKVAIEETFKAFVSLCPLLEEANYEWRWEFMGSKEYILQESDKVDCDLIIMSTKGAKGLDRLWGSRTESVVRDALVPVIVFPSGAEFKGISKIILAVDYTEIPKDHRLYPLLHLADHLKTEIDVLTVNRKESDLSRQEKRNRKLLKYKLESFPHRFSHHFESEVGKGLVEYAQLNEASLLAIMPHDYHFIEQVFHESVSRKMIYESPIPLLILS